MGNLNKEKINNLFQQIKDELFQNEIDEEYNNYMIKVKELQKGLCELDIKESQPETYIHARNDEIDGYGYKKKNNYCNCSGNGGIY